MAVRLLAGPFEVVDKDGRPLVYVLNDFGWYPGVGLMMSGLFPPSSVQEGYRVTLDGICTWIGPRGQWSWWPERRRMVFMDSGGKESMWEPIIFLKGSTPPEDQLDAASDIIYRYVKLRDRRIFARNSTVWHQAGFGPQTEEYPREAFTSLGFFPNLMLPGRNDHDVWLTEFGNAVGCFYDVHLRQRSSPLYYTGIEANFLCYCPEYGVLLSVHEGESATADPYVLRVWSLEVEPTILTDPVPYIGTPKSGQIVTYRVQVLGDHDDPAEGEMVDWTLTGVGLLLDLQSKADAEGYATARVQYLVGETGPSTVGASVTC